MIKRFFIQPVQVMRAPAMGDRYNPGSAAIRNWGNAVVAWSGKGWLAPKGSQTDDNANREKTDSFSWLFLPPTANILYTDRVTILGQLYQVIGEPITAYTPKGLHHLEVRVERVTG